MTETTRGTGKWSQAGVPHKGWIWVDIEDLGEPSATCEMCETQEIRYVQYGSVHATSLQMSSFRAYRGTDYWRSFRAYECSIKLAP